jgi:hypothetical protein
MLEVGMPAGSSYEVVLPGRFDPALLAAFASSGATHATVTSVVLVPTARDADISDVVARLEQRGLEILDVRRLESPAQSSAPEGA